MKHKSIGRIVMSGCLIAVVIAKFAGQQTIKPASASANARSSIPSHLLTILSNTRLASQSHPVAGVLTQNPSPQLNAEITAELINEAAGF
jgi:hypothetical protein